MKNQWTFVFSLALTLMFSGCTSSAKGPHPALAKDFYPVGTSWTESKKVGDRPVKILKMRIGELVQFKGAHYYAVQNLTEGKTKLYDQKTLSFVAQLHQGKTMMAALPHDGRYNRPLTQGKTWTSPFDFYLGDVKKARVDKRYHIQGMERITTTAGEFDAVLIVGVSGRKNENIIRIWYVPELKMPVKLAHFKGKKNIVTYQMLSLPKTP